VIARPKRRIHQDQDPPVAPALETAAVTAVGAASPYD
jgi:hypothetical protein